MRERNILNGVGLDYVEVLTKTKKQKLITYSVGNFPNCCGGTFCYIKSFNKRYPKEAATAIKNFVESTISPRSLNIISTEDPEVIKMLSSNGFVVMSTRSKRTMLVLDQGKEDFTPYPIEEVEEDEDW